MTRVYLIETPNATMAGDGVRIARKGEPYAEAWVKKAELDKLKAELAAIKGAKT